MHFNDQIRIGLKNLKLSNGIYENYSYVNCREN